MVIFDTRSLAEIKRDNARLIAEGEVKKDMARRNIERSQASRENFNLRHGEKVRMVKSVGKGFKVMGGWVGKGVVALGKQHAKVEASKKRRVKKKK